MVVVVVSRQKSAVTRCASFAAIRASITAVERRKWSCRRASMAAWAGPFVAAVATATRRCDSREQGSCDAPCPGRAHPPSHVVTTAFIHRRPRHRNRIVYRVDASSPHSGIEKVIASALDSRHRCAAFCRCTITGVVCIHDGTVRVARN